MGDDRDGITGRLLGGLISTMRRMEGDKDGITGRLVGGLISPMRRLGEDIDDTTGRLLGGLIGTMRRYMFRVISVGPIPKHIAFIMDGNRRFAKKWKLTEGAGHKAGFFALMSLLKYCYEVGVKYVTLYAFSIDNFNRRPDEVQYVMDLMQEKIEGFLKEEGIVNKYGVRVMFIGDLKLLHEPVRAAAEKAMLATAHNTNTMLLICVAYTSSHEIWRAVHESCLEKCGAIPALVGNGVSNGVTGEHEEDAALNKNGVSNAVTGEHEEEDALNRNGVSNAVTGEHEETNALNGNGVSNGEMSKHEEEGALNENGVSNCETGEREEVGAFNENGVCNGVVGEHEEEENRVVKVVDLEKHMYMAVAPDPDILVRSSGETRLSNFLLWQTTNCLLYSPRALWPELGLRHLVWGIFKFQRNYFYLEKKKKQS